MAGNQTTTRSASTHSALLLWRAALDLTTASSRSRLRINTSEPRSEAYRDEFVVGGYGLSGVE